MTNTTSFLYHLGQFQQYTFTNARFLLLNQSSNIGGDSADTETITFSYTAVALQYADGMGGNKQLALDFTKMTAM